MAESQDRSVPISCDETQSYPQETRGELTLPPIGGNQNGIDMEIVGSIAEYLEKLQAAVAAHPQASEKRRGVPLSIQAPYGPKRVLSRHPSRGLLIGLNYWHAKIPSANQDLSCHPPVH